MTRIPTTRTVIFWGFPLAMAAIAVLAGTPEWWGDPNAAPCFEVAWYSFTAPWTVTWGYVTQQAGLAGQVVYVVAALLWLVAVFATVPMRGRFA